ncbi:MAG: MFS transporter [Limnobacter sp.]|nr:MFS transporter [Limnobacter sp.]
MTNRLLASREFLPYFGAQTLGAFLDNVVKNLVTLVLVYGAVKQEGGLSPSLLTNLIGALFILPFVLFSGLAGELAERVEKSRLMVGLKWFELLIVVLTCLGFWLQSTSLILFCVFLLGLQATLFGPVKYSYLPERIDEQLLTKANSYVEASTFLAILAGTLLAGVLVSQVPNQLVWLGLMLMTSVAGLLMAMRIPARGRSATQEQNKAQYLSLGVRLIYRSTVNCIHAAKQVNSVYLSVLGVSSFWCIGSIVLGNLPVIAKDNLMLNAAGLTWLLALFSVGVAVGAMLADLFSGKRLEMGLVPLASLGLAVSLLGLYSNSAPALSASASIELANQAQTLSPYFLDSVPAMHFGAWLAAVGMFGGIFGVPLYTLIQMRAPVGQAGLVISFNNFQNALFMVGGALVCMMALTLGARIEHTLLIAFAVNLIACWVIFKKIPEFGFRLIVLLGVRLVYRINSRHFDVVPHDGPALLVGNHVSWIDALVLSASCRRPMVYVMYYKIFNLPVVGWFFSNIAKAIPIAGKNEDAAVYAQAFDRVSAALQDGSVVCIFPEGALTRDGEIAEFKSGVFKILERNPVDLYAFAMSGLWETAFSRKKRSLGQLLAGSLQSKTIDVEFQRVPSGYNTPEALQGLVKGLRTRA